MTPSPPASAIHVAALTLLEKRLIPALCHLHEVLLAKAGAEGVHGVAVLGEMRVAFDSYLPAINLMLGLVVVAFVCVLLVKRLSTQRQARLAEEPAV